MLCSRNKQPTLLNLLLVARIAFVLADDEDLREPGEGLEEPGGARGARCIQDMTTATCLYSSQHI